MEKNFIIAGQIIKKGERRRITLEAARLYDFTEVGMPVEIIRGNEDGPTLFISAAIHGDEINGIEIIKRLLKHPCLNQLQGTLLAIPIVNVYGFNNKSRYLPDGRDLNRCFPGSATGSLASQLAYIFMQEIVLKSTHGIDLHTGAFHRHNLPHVRGCLDDPETNRLAKAFHVPVIIHSTLRDGSLREAAREHNIPMLLFEGGEFLRFDENVIHTGLQGILSVMKEIGMVRLRIPQKKFFPKRKETYVARSSYWVRALNSGIFTSPVSIGQEVEKDENLGTISDPFGDHNIPVLCPKKGIVIGKTLLPLVNQGDALFHIATFKPASQTEEQGNLFEITPDITRPA